MNGSQLISYFDNLKRVRLPLEKHISDCYKLSFPMRGVMFNSSQERSPEEVQQIADAHQAELYDASAAEGATILASTLVSNMTPANTLWFGLKTDDDNEDAEVKTYLDELAKEVHQGIHASDYDAPAFEAKLDIGISGMCALFIDEGDDADYAFDLWPLTHCWFDASKKGGPIDIVFYQFGLTAEQAEKAYGSRCPKKIIEEGSKDKAKRWQFVQAIMPQQMMQETKKTRRAEMHKFASKHVCIDTKTITRTRGFFEFPLAIPRLMKLPGSVYAQGIMSLALPEARTANDAKRIILGNADMQMGGMWGAVNDGVLNPKTTKIGSRKIIFMDNKDNFFPLNPPGNLNVGDYIIKDSQAAVRKFFFADQMQPLDEGPARTAAEWHYRMGLLRQLLGPMFGRLMYEYLQRIVFRCVGLKIRKDIANGKMPPEKIMDKKQLRLKYVSPLARAQGLEEVAAMDRFEGSLLAKAEARPESLDLYDWDEAERKRANALGVPAVLVLDLEKTAKARKKREDRNMNAVAAQAPATAPQSPTPQTGPLVAPAGVANG